MKITILGCGPSYGVPSLTRGFCECDAKNEKNIRLRTAMLLQDKEVTILFDTGPEIRLELLRVGSPDLTALCYTHSHYDHMAGAEDVRAMMREKDQILPVYGTAGDLSALKDQLSYVLRSAINKPGFRLHHITPYHSFKIKHVKLTPILQQHGNGISIGYRIGDFAYCTDVHSIDEKGWRALQGIKVWVLGCVSSSSHNQKHLSLDTAIQWVHRLKPDITYLTHMGGRMDYDTLCRELPSYIRPAYDGMVIDTNKKTPHK
ncbi:MAG: MBL fold metallo-hydrolase [Alphaproteobacteria bacterium]|nr:MBL fold metallo-hydrolase [Alphaproteobacteria bacterium]